MAAHGDVDQIVVQGHSQHRRDVAGELQLDPSPVVRDRA